MKAKSLFEQMSQITNEHASMIRKIMNSAAEQELPCKDCGGSGEFEVDAHNIVPCPTCCKEDTYTNRTAYKEAMAARLRAAQQLAWDELEPRQREIYLDYARRTA